MIDGLDGELWDIEDEDQVSVEKLEEILAEYDRYYPADKSTGLEWGAGYYDMMRAQAREIELELEWRATLAREEDRQETRQDDERVGL
jgi:hypothetical protein